MRGLGLADGCVHPGVVHIVNLHAFAHLLLVGREEVERILVDVVDALELGAYAYGPRQRTHGYLQFALELVQNLERVASLTVELVDEYYDGGIAHAAHLHQLAGLLLHAFRHVHDDYYTVHGRECAVSVLCKVLVAGRVEDVYLVVAVIESHHGRGYRYAALLLDFHPVAGGGFLYLVAFYGTRYMYGAAEEQQFFSKSGLAGVRVRDNGESAPAFDFLAEG